MNLGFIKYDFCESILSEKNHNVLIWAAALFTLFQPEKLMLEMFILAALMFYVGGQALASSHTANKFTCRHWRVMSKTTWTQPLGACMWILGWQWGQKNMQQYECRALEALTVKEKDGKDLLSLNRAPNWEAEDMMEANVTAICNCVKWSIIMYKDLQLPTFIHKYVSTDPKICDGA